MRQFFLGFSVVAFYPSENCRPEWRTATFFAGGETAESREEEAGVVIFVMMSWKKELPSERPEMILKLVEKWGGLAFAICESGYKM